MKGSQYMTYCCTPTQISHLLIASLTSLPGRPHLDFCPPLIPASRKSLLAQHCTVLNDYSSASELRAYKGLLLLSL
uniref:Secreted protein n=1 Tax=Ascaris lumbricoides TaxID=6252 RepID=A0A0M3I4R4_ASCLU